MMAIVGGMVLKNQLYMRKLKVDTAGLVLEIQRKISGHEIQI